MAQGYWQTLATLQAPGTAIAASASRTSMTVGSTQARYTMPGGLIKQIGDMLAKTIVAQIRTRNYAV